MEIDPESCDILNYLTLLLFLGFIFAATIIALGMLDVIICIPAVCFHSSSMNSFPLSLLFSLYEERNFQYPICMSSVLHYHFSYWLQRTVSIHFTYSRTGYMCYCLII